MNTEEQKENEIYKEIEAIHKHVLNIKGITEQKHERDVNYDPEIRTYMNDTILEFIQASQWYQICRLIGNLKNTTVDGAKLYKLLGESPLKE